MIKVPEDLFKDCVVSMQQVSESLLSVARLMHEGRILGATLEDYDLAIKILQQAIAAQTAQRVIWQACLDEDAPERVQ